MAVPSKNPKRVQHQSLSLMYNLLASLLFVIVVVVIVPKLRIKGSKLLDQNAV